MNAVAELPSLRSGSAPDAATAFERVKDEMAALDASELLRVNVDIPRAVMTVMGALPALWALRPTIATGIPCFSLDAIDKLETYALATWYAHLLTITTPDRDDFAALFEEAKRLRQDLLVAAQALAHRGLLDAAQVAQIRKGQGHADLAGDLVGLATLFTNAWPTIETKHGHHVAGGRACQPPRHRASDGARRPGSGGQDGPSPGEGTAKAGVHAPRPGL